VDYSHGVRLVKRAVTVDGTTRDIRHVLSDAGRIRHEYLAEARDDSLERELRERASFPG